MKRDIELIRAILLKLEAIEHDAESIWSINNRDGAPLVEGWSPQEAAYNYRLMVDSGLVRNDHDHAFRGFVMFGGITWAGHDFLDSVRDPEIWRKTKAVTEKAGSMSFDMVKDVAIDLAKEVAKHAMAAVLG